MTTYSHSERLVIYYINVVAGSLSIFGCVFIIILFFRFSSLRRLPFRLIFYMIVSDLFHSIGLVLPYFLSPVICEVQGYLISYFSLSAVLWSSFIAHAISSTILKNDSIGKYEKFYLFSGYIIPLFCFLSNIYKGYGISSGWCWISEPDNSKSHTIDALLRLFTYYLPLAIVMVYNTYKYTRVIKYLKIAKLELDDQNAERILIIKFKAYPIILVLCQTPVTIIRFYSFFYNNIPWILTAVAGAGISINGFLNALAYGLTMDVKKSIKKIFIGEETLILNASRQYSPK